MAKRERFEERLSCPKCGNGGTVTFDENETPPHHGGRLDTRIVSLPGGLKRGDAADEVMCADCGIVISR
jgi:hypothetical protein